MKLSRDLSLGLLHPRENLFVTGTLGALNAEVQLDCDGCASFALDLRGTFVGTVQVQGSVDGVNWQLIPLVAVNLASVIQVIGATAAGTYVGACAPFRKLRAICTAYTSGALLPYLTASLAPLDPALTRMITPLLGTITAAVGVAATLTLASPGAGLRHYLTYLHITRFAGLALTAAATPVLVTTTNIPGTLVFSLPAEAAAQGTTFVYQQDFAYPVAVSAQATATTIVMPATTGVIWRATAGYYVAP